MIEVSHDAAGLEVSNEYGRLLITEENGRMIVTFPDGARCSGLTKFGFAFDDDIDYDSRGEFGLVVCDREEQDEDEDEG